MLTSSGSSNVSLNSPMTPTSPCELSKTKRYSKRHGLALFVECNHEDISSLSSDDTLHLSSPPTLNSSSSDDSFDLKMIESIDIGADGNVAHYKYNVNHEIISMTYSVIPEYESYPDEWLPYIILINEQNAKISDYRKRYVINKKLSPQQIDRYMRDQYTEYVSKLNKLLSG